MSWWTWLPVRLRVVEQVSPLMSKTLQEYGAWLAERKLLWPKAPPTETAKATPFTARIKGIKAVTWNVYGTLLTISEGQLILNHPQSLRMQIAMEKTIEEFNMWNSMTRRPGKPWEYFLPKYLQAIEDARLTGGVKKGDLPEVNSRLIWRKLIDLLSHKDYKYDTEFYGDLDQLAEKVAYFFQLCLQGCQAAPYAQETMTAIANSGLKQGLLADGQPYTFAQLLRAVEQQGRLPPVASVFAPQCMVISSLVGVRKPSGTLYETALARFAECGVEANEVLYVSSRLGDDLAIAKQHGFRTALYAGDKLSLQATAAECKDPVTKPDRLITELRQVRELVGID